MIVIRGSRRMLLKNDQAWIHLCIHTSISKSWILCFSLSISSIFSWITKEGSLMVFVGNEADEVGWVVGSSKNVPGLGNDDGKTIGFNWFDLRQAVSVFLCLFNASSLLNDRRQVAHWYGFSPVCNFWCRFKSCNLKNCLSQSVHYR